MFSLMECIMENSILGSKDTLYYLCLLPTKREPSVKHLHAPLQYNTRIYNMACTYNAMMPLKGSKLNV